MEKIKSLNALFITLFSCGVATFFTACATTDPQISFRPPVYVEEIPPREEEEDFGNPGSIFGRGDNLLFSDRRAMQLNDLVTVIINQTAQASSSADKNLHENSNSTLTGPGITFGGPSQSIGNVLISSIILQDLESQQDKILQPIKAQALKTDKKHLQQRLRHVSLKFYKMEIISLRVVVRC